MTKLDSHHLCFLLLFMVCINGLTRLNAQVYIQVNEDPIGQITETTLARINVLNTTGVEIHYNFKGYLTTADGRELLRLKSELLKHQPGYANFAEEHLGPVRQLNVDPFANLTTQFAAEDWSTYTGEVNFRAELIHPLDTFSIIAREDKARWLKAGVFVDKEGNYTTDPRLIKVEMKLGRDRSFEIDSLLHYFDIINNNVYPHAAPLKIIVKQNGRIFYELAYKLPTLGVGKQDFKRADFELVLDKYDTRNRQQHMEMLVSCGDHGPSAFVATPQHARYTNTKATYRSRALGLSFDHLEYATATPFRLAGGPTVIFDEQGEIVEIAPAPLRQYAYVLPLDYPQGFQLGRDGTNGSVSVSVYDWTSLSEAEWGRFFAKNCNFSAADIQKEKVDDIEIWLRPNYEPSVYHPERLLSSRSLWIAIRDSDRLLIIEHRKVIADQALPNYVAAQFEWNEIDFFNSLQYNGLGFKTEVDASGQLRKLTPYQAEKTIPQPERNATFERFRGYTALANLHEEGFRYNDVYGRDVPDVEALDQALERSLLQPLVEALKVSKITPDLDTIRKYATYEWPEADLRFVHRIAEKRRMEPSVGPLFETASFDQTTDSLLSVNRSNSPLEQVAEPGVLAVPIALTSLGLWELPTQVFRIDHFENQQLTDRQLAAIVADENSSQISRKPTIQQVQLGDWRVFASTRLKNPLRRFGTGNMILIKTPSRIYRLRITGGFESDISPFLNSVEIAGKRLRVEYGKDGQLVKIWRE